MTDHDLPFMRRAIALSRQALACGNAPYGAVLVKQGVVLAEACNQQHSDNDCTAHAETVLVRNAQRALGLPALQAATVYASGEPCAMCSGAMYWAGVRRVVYGASNAEMARLMGGPLLPISARAVLAGASETLEVEGPCLEREALEVLQDAARSPAHLR